jgi:hypothetical protein
MLIFFGIFLQLIGFFLCFTIIGMVLGIPLIIIGGTMILFGFFGRKTTITNVITVSHPGETKQATSEKAVTTSSEATISNAPNHGTQSGSI